MIYIYISLDIDKYTYRQTGLFDACIYACLWIIYGTGQQKISNRSGFNGERRLVLVCGTRAHACDPARSSVWKYAFHYLDRSFLKTLDVHWCRYIACLLWLAGHWLTVEPHKGKEKEAWFLCVRLRCALPSRSIAVDRVQAGRPGSRLIARHMDKLDRASAPPSDRSTCK